MRLYPAVMGPRWDGLPAVIRQAHLSADTLRGTFEVRHGATRLARTLARLLRCPAESPATPVTLRVEADETSERWHRMFGRRRMITRQRCRTEGVLDEQVSVLELRFRLEASGDALRFDQIDARLRLGRVAMPWPRWCRPHVDAVERAEPDGVAVRVEVTLPRVGLLVSYAGRLAVPAAIIQP